MKAKTIFHLSAAFAAAALVAAPAVAQRDAAYQAARDAGQVGEKMDGYLGTIGNVPAAVDGLVRKINIMRKDVYTAGASRSRQPVSVEEFAFGAGCKNILDTVPGEKYEAPDHTWRTRTSEPPVRHSSCP